MGRVDTDPVMAAIRMLAAMAQEEPCRWCRHRDHLERQFGEAHAAGNRADPLSPMSMLAGWICSQIRKPVDQRPALGLHV